MNINIKNEKIDFTKKDMSYGGITFKAIETDTIMRKWIYDFGISKVLIIFLI
tara:strand:+ start:3803 stop:3958 length:156 start_codon:yes stop_codon:yes gene_type:complete